MAYAGIQTMLLAYKLQKSDEVQKMQDSIHKIVSYASQTKTINDQYEAEMAAIESNEDMPNYKQIAEQKESVAEEYEDMLAEIAAWEETEQQKKSDAEAKIALLDGYINSWQGALSSAVSKSHTYAQQ